MRFATPRAPVWLVAGLSNSSQPIAGGILVPSPNVVLAGFTTDAEGALDIEATWPADLPDDTVVFLHFLHAWMVDNDAPGGLAATTTISATASP